MPPPAPPAPRSLHRSGYRSFLHDVTVATLIGVQDNKRAAMLVYQENIVGIYSEKST